jgi:hypothetical protein
MAGVLIEFPEAGDGFRLDCTELIQPGRTAEVTSNEIEDGSAITDHRIIHPLTLQITGFLSDVPLDATGTYSPEGTGPHVDWRERLEQAHERSEFLSVDCGPTRGTYDNLLITSLDIQWDTSTGNGLQVSLSLQQVRIARPQSRNLTAERLAQERLLLADAAKANLMPVKAGAFNGVLAATGGTLVSTQETLGRFQPERSLGRLTAQTAPSSLSDLAADALAPAGVPAGITNFFRGN